MSLLAIVLCGAGLVATGFPARAGSMPGLLFRATAAMALGIGVSSAWFATRLMASGRPPGRADQAVLCAAGATLWLFFRRKAASDPHPRDPAPAWLWSLFAVACAIAAAAFVEHTLRFPDGGWDAWMIWNLRARFLVRGADYRAAFSRDLLYMAHQDYPWLLPGVVAQGFSSAGEMPLVPGLVAALFGILALAIVVSRLSACEGTRWGILGGLALVAMPCFPIFASNQQADVPVSVYLALASALIAATSSRELWLAGFAAGLGMWTKNEGSLYAAALLGAFLLRRRDPRGAMTFVLGALPFAALLLWFKVTLAPPNDLSAFSTSASILGHAIDPRRWLELLLLVLRRIVYFQDFGLWLVAAAVATIVLARRRLLTLPALALLFAFAAFGPIYVLQPHHLDWLFRTSADRLLVQMWPAALVASIPALRSYASPSIESASAKG